MLTSAAEVIDAFGGVTAFADIIGKGVSTASEMKRNGSIPARYWAEVIAAAKAQSIPGINYESLALMHARTRDAPETAPAESNPEKVAS